MRILYSICACAAVILALHGAARAGSISTPILFHGDGTQLVCIANNVSAQTQQVTVSIVSLSDTTTETCELPAGQGGMSGLPEQQPPWRLLPHHGSRAHTNRPEKHPWRARIRPGRGTARSSPSSRHSSRRTEWPHPARVRCGLGGDDASQGAGNESLAKWAMTSTTAVPTGLHAGRTLWIDGAVPETVGRSGE